MVELGAASDTRRIDPTTGEVVDTLSVRNRNEPPRRKRLGDVSISRIPPSIDADFHPGSGPRIGRDATADEIATLTHLRILGRDVTGRGRPDGTRVVDIVSARIIEDTIALVVDNSGQPLSGKLLLRNAARYFPHHKYAESYRRARHKWQVYTAPTTAAVAPLLCNPRSGPLEDRLWWARTGILYEVIVVPTTTDKQRDVLPLTAAERALLLATP